MSPHKFYGNILLLLIVLGSYAQDNCSKWSPNLIEGICITEYNKPQNARLRQAVNLADNMIKTNPHFLSIPDARLFTSGIITTGYPIGMPGLIVSKDL